ncbi:proliferating cell nuclear antigen (pcna) [Candidatus Micrarchaeota archaeon]|nr:proliferating cell nuclear antigen (pcna) [Candidatus Micrarchaeota archaeon]MBD3417740.1 proliferating cell nuclear antigen (pcna) [Candidatus Micrarchaeota archaeon]
MKITMEEAPALKDAIEAVVNLVEEGVFEVNEDGLSLKAMDPSQISMVSFSMPKSMFSEYVVGDQKRIGLDIGKLARVLARGNSGESVELEVDEGRLNITFKGKKRKRVFKLPLLDLGEGLEREPKIEYKNKAVMRSDVLREVLKDAKLVSTHISFVLDGNVLKVEIKGDDGEIKEEFEKEGEALKELEIESGAKATYPLSYMEDIIKGSKGDTDIMMCIESDRPLKIEYSIVGANAKYFLAPRIENV